MHSVLEVTTPAADPLLSVEELRAIAGVSGESEDAKLTALGAAVTAAIMAECNIAVGQGADPTLLQETLKETFLGGLPTPLVLSRRHNVEITSIVVDSVTLETEAYIVDPEEGTMLRMEGDSPRKWQGEKAVVIYKAGFETVPPDLKQAASDFVRLAWFEAQRDPAVKGEQIEIPGVETKRTDYWVGAVPGGQSSEGAVPEIVAGKLKRYRNAWVF